MPADTLPKLIRKVEPLDPTNEAYLREVAQREGWTVLPHKDLRSILGEIDRLRALVPAPTKEAKALADLLS